MGTPADYRIAGMNMHVRNKGKVAWGVMEESIPGSEPPVDPATEVNDQWYHVLMTGIGGIAIATVSAETASGASTYEFLEIYRPYAKHKIDVVKDGEHGKSKRVTVSGNLNGVLDEAEPYSDVLLYPLTIKAAKYSPFFLRERLMRETTMLIIDGIQVVEVKWYEQGVFKAIFTFIAIVVSCYLSACATTGALVTSMSAAASAFVAYAAMAILVGVVLTAILSFIDNPILAAIVVIVVAVATGQINADSYLKMATLAVEATGTYIQKKFVQEMIEMEEKMKEFRQNHHDLNEKMDEMMESAGMSSNVNKDYALMKMTMPPPGEKPADFLERALNTDYAIIPQDAGVAGKRVSALPNYSKYNN